MQDDERDRGDPTEPSGEAAPDGAPPPEETPPGEQAESEPDAEPEPVAAAPEPEPPAPISEPDAAGQPPVADETAAWPQTDLERTGEPDAAPASAEAWPTTPPAPDDAAGDAWPTEPPAADSGGADAWPTDAPERGDESQIPAPEALMPPPSEVEAYGSPPPTDEAAAIAGTSDPGTAAHSVPAAAAAIGESTQCPRCGTENRPGLAFCTNCGQRLVAAGVAPTIERPGTPEGTQACPRCGTHNRAGVAFCQNCGANLRAAATGYVPPAVAGAPAPAAQAATRGGATLGPVVLLIGAVGVVTAWLLPFAYGAGSLYERILGAGGFGIAFWNGYPDAGLADQIYYGLAAPAPVVAGLLLLLAIGGVLRAAPGALQRIGLFVALIWSAAIVVLFAALELLGNWDGDLLGLLRALTPAGIIFFLAGLIVVIGTLTRFARS